MPQSKLTIRSYLTCYRTKLRPILEYAAPIWGGLPEYLTEEIGQVQNKCLKILGSPQNELQTLKERRDNITMEEIRRIIKDNTHPCNKFISPSVLTTNTNYGRSPAFHSRQWNLQNFIISPARFLLHVILTM